MKILYSGSTGTNAGPDNVNKGMVKNLTQNYTYIKSNNKLLKAVEIFGKCLVSDVVVVSGVARMNAWLIKLAKKLGKKTVYIMHGCVEYEGPLNRQDIPDFVLQQEKTLLEKADLILPVSQKFQKWVQTRYPQYGEKTGYLFNGIEAEELQNAPKLPKISGLVVAAGADRIIKNNRIVAQVVDQMHGKANLEICGFLYGDISNEKYTHAKYTGRLEHDEFIKRLAQAEVYILNSLQESFCLTVIEALMCGCSVLVSAAAGVVDVLDLEDMDIIYDPMNQEEIKRKLEYVLKHPNNQRICAGLNLEERSYGKSVERLEALCAELLRT